MREECLPFSSLKSSMPFPSVGLVRSLSGVTHSNIKLIWLQEMGQVHYRLSKIEQNVS